MESEKTKQKTEFRSHTSITSDRKALLRAKNKTIKALISQICQEGEAADQHHNASECSRFWDDPSCLVGGRGLKTTFIEGLRTGPGGAAAGEVLTEMQGTPAWWRYQ
jgi:hypothetical protein